MAGQRNVHGHLGQLVAVLDEAVCHLDGVAQLLQVLRAHHGVDAQTAVQRAAVGLAGLLVGILEEEAGHARRVAGAQLGADDHIAHDDGLVVVIEIGDGVIGDLHRRDVLLELLIVQGALMLDLVLLGQPDLGTGHLVQVACAAGMIAVPVGQEDLLDVLGVMAGTPDAVDQQIQRLRAQTGIDQDQAGTGVDQEGCDVVLTTYVPDVGCIAVNRDGVLPVSRHCLFAHAEASGRRSIEEFLFHKTNLPRTTISHHP